MIQSGKTHFWHVGQSFTHQYQTSSATSLLGWTVKNLPPGLQFNLSTGLLSGRFTQAGSYQTQILTRNVAGTSIPLVEVFTVQPVSEEFLGTFSGTINPSSMNDHLGGRWRMTVTPTGSFTVKLEQGSLTARSSSSPRSTSGGYVTTSYTGILEPVASPSADFIKRTAYFVTSYGLNMHIHLWLELATGEAWAELSSFEFKLLPPPSPLYTPQSLVENGAVLSDPVSSASLTPLHTYPDTIVFELIDAIPLSSIKVTHGQAYPHVRPTKFMQGYFQQNLTPQQGLTGKLSAKVNRSGTVQWTLIRTAPNRQAHTGSDRTHPHLGPWITPENRWTHTPDISLQRPE